MLAVIRLRGISGVPSNIRKILETMKLKTTNSTALLEDSPSSRGMLKKSGAVITWGEADKNTEELLKKKKSLMPPRKGFTKIREFYPNGELGYRGGKINELIQRMNGNDVKVKVDQNGK
jgi:ribosomal protein L30/L7E